MTRLATLLVVLLLLPTAPAAGQLDRLLKDLGLSSGRQTGLSDERIASGLKEALRVGAGHAADLTGRVDGYFANQAIRILMPERLRGAETALRTVGYGAQVDDFVVGMNRAAERAAPFARDIFADAITAMSFEDARRILSGGDTAATQYFRERTSERLTAAFRPVVERSMNEVGVSRQYKELLGLARSVPFLRLEALDIDAYVVGKGLDGLFFVLAEEERTIRRDPAARVTELLRDVFGAAR